MSESQYVLLVHGTWTDSPGWHKFDESRPNNFASRLNQLLAKRGIHNAVGRDAGSTSTHFFWSGQNDHRARLEAAQSLTSLINSIHQHNPSARIHIVGHSHGCNVVIKAVELQIRRSLEEANEIWNTILFSLPERPFRLPANVTAEGFVKRRLVNREQKLFEDHSAAFEILYSILDRASRERDFKNRNAQSRLYGERYAFLHAWLNADGAFPVARLVFFGPPFLKKYWINRPHWVRGAIRVGDSILGALIGPTIIYIISMLLWSVLYLLSWLLYSVAGIGPASATELNPSNWNIVLLVLAGVLAIGSALVGGSIAADSSRRENANFYFDGREIRDVRGFAANGGPSDSENAAVEMRSGLLPLSCLTVTAELLDEVMLGFSSEPIVYGALLPQLENMSRPNFSLRLPPVPLGHNPGVLENIGRDFYVLRRIVMSCVKVVAAPAYRYWQRSMARGLMRLINSTAFGVPLYEVRNAIVKASNRIDEPLFFRENVWDVTKHLVRGAAGFEDEQDRDRRYSFLWDQNELAERRQKSMLWTRIERYKDRIASHFNQYGSEFNQDDALAKTCVMLEERTKEAIGAVGLAHLAYHSDVEICEAVAEFIASGALPENVNSSLS